MRKIYLCKVLLFYFLLSAYLVSAQDVIGTKKPLQSKVKLSKNLGQPPRCQTQEVNINFEKRHPNYPKLKDFNNWIEQKISEKKNQKNAKLGETDYTLPIIFHIINDGEAVGQGSNVSQSLINSQLEQLNLDYANLSGTTWTDPSIAANTRIQFCLAKVDPYGKLLAEPGIERIDRNQKGFVAPPFTDVFIEDNIKPVTSWDPNKYINVWVLDTDYALGYAYYPPFSTLPGLDDFEVDVLSGVVILYSTVGSINNPGSEPDYSFGRTLTHELGHYLGMIHIWGDEDCGNDYCDDIPTQQDPNFGCPGVRPTSCNNTGDMYENYMDYVDDACMNTFTKDQKFRMQTVMENSPRRIPLATSPVCAAVVVPNAISFLNYSLPNTETGNQGVCPRYKEFPVTVKISGAATGNATVNLIALNSSTATLGKDYIITPSSVNYVNGDAADKVVTVRIFDDAAFESDEVLKLGFEIIGNGVVPGFANQNCNILIEDDDFSPSISLLPTTLLNENFGTLNNPPDLSGWSVNSFSGVGVNEWTVDQNGGGDVTGLSAYITQDVNNGPNTYNFTSASEPVLLTPLINPSGEFKQFTLSFKYKSNGEKAGNTFRDYGRIYYSFNGVNFTTINDNNNVSHKFQGVNQMTDFSVALPAAVDNKPFYIGFRWSNNASLGNNPPFTLDDIKIDAAQGRGIETEVAESKITTINSVDETYFISPVDGDVITKIKNTNANIGCVTASLSAGGNGQVDITTTGGMFKRTQKVLQIIPEVPNNNATYEGTLYFTADELAVWGPDKLNLKILKVKDGVNLNGIIQAGDVEIISPTSVTEFADKGYIAYTADFTGFSQFMLAESDIILPIQLLAFQARPLYKSIQLDWSTSFENNNKGFKIERSEDGIAFIDIGWIDGKGNSSNEQKYRYEDKQVKLNTTYYYRLRQVDFNTAEKVSETRIARIGKDETVVQVRPNPTAGIIKLQVLSSANIADVEVYNAKGQKVINKPKTILNGQMIELNLSAFAQGVYNVVVTINNRKITTSVIKQ